MFTINYNPITEINKFKATFWDTWYKKMQEISHDYDINGMNKFHGEGSIWSHTMMVLSSLFTSSPEAPSIELFYAALLHDIGKVVAVNTRISEKDDGTKYTKNTFYNHQSFSVPHAMTVVDKLLSDEQKKNFNYRRFVELINLHMMFNQNYGHYNEERKVFEFNSHEKEEILSMFRFNRELFHDLKILSSADNFGRITYHHEYEIANSRNQALTDIYYSTETLYYEEFRHFETDDLHKLVMFIGLPGSGKSTKRKESYEDQDFVIVSMDDEIEKIAAENKITYTEAFTPEIAKFASDKADKDFAEAISKGKNILIDMTNLSLKSRRKKLNKIRCNYIKEAVVFICSGETLDERAKKREKEGRIIPDDVLFRMSGNFTVPSYEEFDYINYIFS